LLDLGRRLGAEVQSQHAHTGFDVRLGVHTGDVLLGGGVDAEGTIRGMAVNIAARMEQTAPAGGLRISHDTYNQVRGLFDVEVQAPLAVKGVLEPVQSYLVQRAKPRSFRIGTRGIEGVSTRMVGRDAELAQLQAAFARLWLDGCFDAVTVVADAGLGKSRLLHEFEAWAELRPEAFFIFRGRNHPHTGSQAFGLLRDIVAWRLQIHDDDTLAQARQKLEAAVVPLFTQSDGADMAEGHAHLLGHLVGIDYSSSRHVQPIIGNPQQIRRRGCHAAAQFLRRLSAQGAAPVLLLLEDLHWADTESLDWLRELADANRDLALLMVASSRPTLFERRPDWLHTPGMQPSITLQALDGPGSHTLVQELLKKLPAAPAALRKLITDGAEGNPFYMEELVKMLIDQGTITTAPTGWALHGGKLQATKVPSTLTGVLQARLDGLPAPERLTLQEASVIGQVFWDQALMALDEQARLSLPGLVRRELTLARAEDQASIALQGLREYAFKHALLHQVTYGTVLRRDKRVLHGKLAAWLAQQSGLRANDWLALTAQHHEQAGDAASAAEFHAQAAEQAATRFAHERVLVHVQKALALLEGAALTLPALRWRLLLAREAALGMQGKRHEQRADLDALQALAQTLDDNQCRAQAAGRLANLGLRTGDRGLQESSARQAVKWAQLAGDHGLRMRCQRIVASALAHQGHWQAGQALTQEVLVQAKALGDRQMQSACLGTLAVIAREMQDDPVSALALEQQGLAIDRALGDRQAEAGALHNVGLDWASLGALGPARQALEEALQLDHTTGNQQAECTTLSTLGWVHRLRGDHAQALATARQAHALALRVQARPIQATALCDIGHAELALQQFGPAQRAFEDAAALALAIHDPRQHDATVGLARVALQQGDLPKALQHVQKLLAHLAAGVSYERCDGRLLEWTCFEVLRAAGDAQAQSWLARAHAAVQATARSIQDDGLRQGFLSNIALHREILAAWAQAQHDPA
jgi:tetratricopeptide (TPR) repeat protein